MDVQVHVRDMYIDTHYATTGIIYDAIICDKYVIPALVVQLYISASYCCIYTKHCLKGGLIAEFTT